VWFPVIGAAIGLSVGGIWWLAARAWAPAVAGAIAVASDAALTGFLHLDGLADSADGLVAPMDRTRRLEVMADPAVGAFGMVALVVILLLRFGSFASTDATPLVIGGLWCGSRTAMALMLRLMPYARPGGLASAFQSKGARSPWQSSTVAIGVLGIGGAIALAVLGRGTHGLVSVGAEAVGVLLVAWLAYRRIGGMTGDVLGAAGVVGETAGLLMLAAKW
jgi:adenosylcobinamide-GDP ribazoletransferase